MRCSRSELQMGAGMPGRVCVGLANRFSSPFGLLGKCAIFCVKEREESS